MAFCQALVNVGGWRDEAAEPEPCVEVATGAAGGWELCDHHRCQQIAQTTQEAPA